MDNDVIICYFHSLVHIYIYLLITVNFNPLEYFSNLLHSAVLHCLNCTMMELELQIFIALNTD